MPSGADAKPVMLETGAAAGYRLRVVFRWQGDRHLHSIAVVDGDQTLRLLESREGSPAEDWPSSPPLQQLSVETRANQARIALLLGMAGKSHWSVSVEASAAAPTLVFDVACRAQQPPERLGSSYQADGALDFSADRRLATLSTRPNCCLKVQSIRDHPDSRIEQTASGLAIVHSTLAVRVPATLRWKYRLELA